MRVASFFAALLAATSAFGSDFRGHGWGDGIDAVVTTHGMPMERTGDLLVYERPLGGQRTFVTFAFEQGRLVQGSYFLHSNPPETAEALESYRALNGLLVERYGQGAADHIWRRGMVYGDVLEQEQELAVASGDLLLLNRWRTAGTELRHVLRGEHFELDHGLVYSMLRQG